MDKQLHIICHRVPWPADFGGVQDIFYSIVALHRLGVSINLHCFTEDMQTDIDPLKNYCQSVQLYKRNTGFKKLSRTLPYIVNTRNSKALVETLELDNIPIFIQGVHCTSVLNKLNVKNRKVAVRLFNVETKYYKSLAKLEHNLAKKIYYKAESRLLEKYEEKLAKKCMMLCISETDKKYYQESFSAVNVRFLPAFTGHKNVRAKKGKGDYILYHANLSVNENFEIAKWLIKEIAGHCTLKLKIAGKNPSAELKELAGNRLEIIENPSQVEMDQQIAEAHINIVSSYNNTGVKLKLLNALFNGRHCLSNIAGVTGSGLDDLVHLAESNIEIIQLIENLASQDFTEVDIENRQIRLYDLYNDDSNAQTICDLLL